MSPFDRTRFTRKGFRIIGFVVLLGVALPFAVMWLWNFTLAETVAGVHDADLAVVTAILRETTYPRLHHCYAIRLRFGLRVAFRVNFQQRHIGAGTQGGNGWFGERYCQQSAAGQRAMDLASATDHRPGDLLLGTGGEFDNISIRGGGAG